MPGNFNIKGFLLILLGWIFSVCFHEFSHALVAYFGGDKSVKSKGYLTFNPLKYTHPLYSIAMPIVFLLIGGIGLPGGAVYIDKDKLRNRLWDAATSTAGPLSNVLLLSVMLVPLNVFEIDFNANRLFWSAYSFLCYLQITGIFLNLLPLPPLDGFGAVSALLPKRLRLNLYRLSSLFLLVIFFGLMRVDPVRDFFWQFVYRVAEQVRIPLDLVYEGYQMIKFDLVGSLRALSN